MGANETNGLLVVTQKERHFSALHDRNFKLADLIALGQIGVEIVFAGKDAALGHMRIDGQPKFDGTLHSAHVHDGQRAGQRQIDGAGLRVGFGAKCGGSAAENLALRGELGVGFKADDDFVALDEFGGIHGQTPSGVRR